MSHVHQSWKLAQVQMIASASRHSAQPSKEKLSSET
eukprot:CAMPEP_0183556358 /NCGR_PEP_ID=MMETSP0371-20130417/82338_1 /TAXON_ID=268820 /ORGANISM="Peridinium aciculiferum, Strain PAER-2" /LENGTH=35 /DNA_ID= /DNA_START= /DNA_END= /DNA_ORIENTATION=